MGLYFLFGLIAGLAAGVIFSRGLSVRQRAAIPGAISVLCLPTGFVALLFSLLNSTAPSFAPRISVTGNAFNCVEHRLGKSSTYSFRVEPEHGEPLQIGTQIVVPPMCWKTSDYDAGGIYRITYLADTKRHPANEAIDIEVLTGRNAGWHKRLDARPFGLWLGTPAGGFLMFIGLYLTRDNKGREGSAAAPSTSV